MKQKEEERSSTLLFSLSEKTTTVMNIIIAEPIYHSYRITKHVLDFKLFKVEWVENKAQLFVDM